MFIKQNNNEATYFSFNDLNKYIINNELPYSEFCRIIKIFDILPVKIKIGQDVKILKSFSTSKLSDEFYSYKLLDKDIFVQI